MIEQLTRQLRLPPGAVSVVDTAEAVWPDACLGLAAEDEICANVLTPGFALKAEAGGASYEFRTDLSARHIRLAAAPPLAIGEPRLTWRDARSFTVLRVGSDGLAFGRRGRPLLTAPFPGPGRAAELRAFVTTYAPLQSRTAGGEVILRGVGLREATPAERRMLAEWARVVEHEAEAGAASSGSVLTWTRAATTSEPGEMLVVDRTGFASLFSARSTVRELIGGLRLAPAELERVYGWMDALASFSGRPPGTPDADLALTGEGTDEPSADTLAEIAALMEALAGRIAGR